MKDCKETKMRFGTIRTYENDGELLIAYETNDPISDQVILVKKGDRLLSVEAPLFKDNVQELNDYVKSLGVHEISVLLVDHVAPIDYLPEATLYTTTSAIDSLRNGAAIGLFKGFAQTFGDKIQSVVRDDYNLIDGVKELGGITLNIIAKGEDFDVYLPSFNAVYTHMLGHDVHSIIGGDAGADSMIAELSSFIENAYSLVLTSHHIPENLEDVKAKIAYVQNIKKLAREAKTKEDFIASARASYPDYQGLNYLDITASIYFDA